MVDSDAWGMVTFRRAGSDIDEAGIMRSDGTIVQPDAFSDRGGLIAILANWDHYRDIAGSLKPETMAAIDDAVPLAPLRYPAKLICAGANYRDHMAEMGDAELPAGSEPFFFFVPPTTTIVPSGQEVVLPDDHHAKVDYEAELAAVIGRRATNVPGEEALDYVAGYACLNDLTARGFLPRKVSFAPPFAFDWAASKGLDGFCPLGPITPAAKVGDTVGIGVRCRVNGELRQNGNTADMIFDVATLIAFASRFWTLEPGDVIATGTPAGVGARSGRFLKPGDVVDVEIDGLMPLSTPLVGR